MLVQLAGTALPLRDVCTVADHLKNALSISTEVTENTSFAALQLGLNLSTGLTIQPGKKRTATIACPVPLLFKDAGSAENRWGSLVGHGASQPF